MSALVHIAHPLAPEIGLRHFPCDPALTVEEAIAAAGWRDLPATTVLLRPQALKAGLDLADSDLRRALVPRREWAMTPVGDGAALATLPAGGGNNGASQVLTVVAAIALAVFAPEIGAFALGELGVSASAVAFAGVTYGSLATVGVTLAGSMVISALIPPPRSPNAGAGVSPTYSLSAQSNLARLGQPVPEMFGRMNMYSDLAAAPYSEYGDNNTQLLYELFCDGCGDYAYEQVRIGNNAVWENGAYTGTYPEITIEFVPPGNKVTLFPTNVVTSVEVSSIEMKGPNQDGVNGYVYGWTGPFPLTAAGVVATEMAIDIALPGGLVYTNSGGNHIGEDCQWTVQVQAIDNYGNAIGAWIDVPDCSDRLVMQTFDPIYRTYRADLVALGITTRCQVRMERLDNSYGNSNGHQDQMFWVALRGYVPSDVTYGNRSMLAIRASASANLNGTTAQKLNTVKTRKLPLYDPATKTWSAATATRSIAAAASYICRSSNGLGKADSEIDLDALWAMDATWTARGDYADGVFDTRQSAWDALTAVLRCGRARPIRAGNQITFVRDEPKTVPRAAFSPANILPQSFKAKYQFAQPADVRAFNVAYVDERTWTQNTVLVDPFNTGIAADDAAQVQALLMVQRDQVWREYAYQLGQSAYRRIFPTVQTELDGRVCLFGDLVTVSHWLANWGMSALALDLTEDAGGDLLRLSESWTPTIDPANPTLLARIATPDGQVYGPVEIDLVDDGNDTGEAIIRLKATASVPGKYAGKQPRDWPVWSGSGLQMERPRVLLGTGNAAPQDALVVSMQPNSNLQATVALAIEDARVHTIDQSGPPAETSPPPGATGEDLTITAVSIVESSLGDGSGKTQLGISISGAPDAKSFQYSFKWASTDSYSAGAPCTRSFSLPSRAGTFYLEVQAVGASGSGASYVVAPFVAAGSAQLAPADVGAITTTQPWASGSNGAWQWPAVSGASSYSVQVEAQHTTGDPWSVVRTDSALSNGYTYYASFETGDGGPFAALRIGVKAINSAGMSTDWSYSI